MAKWKYLVVRLGNLELPVLFPEQIDHSAMAAGIRHAIFGSTALAVPSLPVVVGAGFVEPFEAQVVPGRGSESLRIATRGKTDESAINDYWRHGGKSGNS